MLPYMVRYQYHTPSQRQIEIGGIPMNVYDAIINRRSIRKFRQIPLERTDIERWINGARLAPQAANLQPVKYLVEDDPSLLSPVFDTTKWAAYLYPDHTPEPDQRPVAYIVLLIDTQIKAAGYDTDAGACGENLILCAQGDGVGSCWLGAVNRPVLAQVLNISHRFLIHSVIALGYPDESPVSEPMSGDAIQYYEDSTGTLHVPKRSFSDLVFYNHG